MSAAVAKKQPSLSLLDKAIAKWREVFVPYKKACIKADQLEQKVDKAKDHVISLMQKAGIESHESPYGKVSLQAKPSTNYEALIDDVIVELRHKGIELAAFVDMPALREKHTKVGDVFVRAPQAWSGKAS
jgi:hypothetical protein